MLSLPTLSALVLLALALALVAANGFVDENPTDSDFASCGIGRKLMQLNVGGGDEDEDGEGSRGLQQRRINSALHYAGKNDQKTSLVTWHNATSDLHKGFHTYKVEWTPKSMKFFRTTLK